MNFEELKKNGKEFILEKCSEYLDSISRREFKMNTKEWSVRASNSLIICDIETGLKKVQNGKDTSYNKYAFFIEISSDHIKHSPEDYFTNSEAYVFDKSEQQLLEEILSLLNVNLQDVSSFQLNCYKDQYVVIITEEDNSAVCYEISVDLKSKNMLWHEHPHPIDYIDLDSGAIELFNELK